MSTANTALVTAFAFCEKIGLQLAWEPGANGFLKGIRIDKGRILVDPGAAASALLHEAGHLAILPPDLRHKATGDLEALLSDMATILADEPIDSPYQRALLQCSDTEATAWAWAAGIAAGLSHTEIIQDQEYDGGGADIRVSLACRAYVGIHGLKHADFCVLPRQQNTNGYPHMLKWLQDAQQHVSERAGETV